MTSHNDLNYINNYQNSQNKINTASCSMPHRIELIKMDTLISIASKTLNLNICKIITKAQQNNITTYSIKTINPKDLINAYLEGLDSQSYFKISTVINEHNLLKINPTKLLNSTEEEIEDFAQQFRTSSTDTILPDIKDVSALDNYQFKKNVFFNTLMLYARIFQLTNIEAKIFATILSSGNTSQIHNNMYAKHPADYVNMLTKFTKFTYQPSEQNKAMQTYKVLSEKTCQQLNQEPNKYILAIANASWVLPNDWNFGPLIVNNILDI